mgnify:FL=1
MSNYSNQSNICECGGRYTRPNKSSHFKSKKHQNYIENPEGKYLIKPNLEIRTFHKGQSILLKINNLDEFIEVIKEPLNGKDKLKNFITTYIYKTNHNIISYQLKAKKTGFKKEQKIHNYINECLDVLQDKFDKKTETSYIYGVSPRSLTIHS